MDRNCRRREIPNNQQGSTMVSPWMMCRNNRPCRRRAEVPAVGVVIRLIMMMHPTPAWKMMLKFQCSRLRYWKKTLKCRRGKMLNSRITVYRLIMLIFIWVRPIWPLQLKRHLFNPLRRAIMQARRGSKRNAHQNFRGTQAKPEANPWPTY